MKEALFWSSEEDGKIRCRLCPHDCLVAEGKSGICRVRKNMNGKLYSTVYGNPAALHSDPIEKKPLYHFHPGKQILSVGTYGCNLRCSFCQNWHISQSEPGNSEIRITPDELALKATRLAGNLGMAYTYNEPTVFYEFMLDTAMEIASLGMKNVVVSNGFIHHEPLDRLLSYIDAFNIDLKSFSNEFYHKMTGGNLQPVLETLKAIVYAGKHLEITFLVIPALNDSPDEFDAMTDWIAGQLGPDVPLHLSRYFPSYKLSNPPTPVATLNRFAQLASQKLHYVFTGNVSEEEHASSFCPECKAELIHRNRYDVKINGLTDEGKCARCGTAIPVRM
jgi:pyruvate formate lyase activating enzyme